MNSRHSIRKQGHDYSTPGNSFVTVCVRNCEPLLGVIDGEEVVLSEMGVIVQEEWQVLSQRFPTIYLDAFVIMPNHVHGIITIVGASLAGARPVDQSDGMDRNILNQPVPVSAVRAGASPALRWVPSSAHSNRYQIVDVERCLSANTLIADLITCGRGKDRTQ